MSTHWFLLWFLSFVQNSIHYHNFYSFSFFILFLSFFIHSIHSLDSFTFSLFLFYSYTLSIHQSIHQSILSLSHILTRFQKYARFGRSLFSQFSHEQQRDMEEEYDTDAFMIFVIAMISIYIVFASWFLFRRIRRLFNKEPSVRIMHMKWVVDSV